MARYNRINLDGKSITETRTAAVSVKTGALMAISGDKFVSPTGDAAVEQLYVANTGHLQGLTADQDIPSGDSIEGEYFETGRGLAVLVDAGSVLVKDTPLASMASPNAGKLKIAGGDDRVVAYSQEDYTVGDEPELVWVRGA